MQLIFAASLGWGGLLGLVLIAPLAAKPIAFANGTRSCSRFCIGALFAFVLPRWV